MARSEEEKRTELQAVVEQEIRNGDPEFVTELLVSREADPLEMITWLEKRAEVADPETAPFWHETVRRYAQHYLDEKTHGVYADTSVLEQARDRANMILGERESSRWPPG